MSFACPTCGTDYAKKLARLERLPPRVRCHRCGTVWNPAAPDAGAEATAETTTLAVPRAAPHSAVAAAKPARLTGRLRLVSVLWTLTLVLVLAGAGGFGYAFRDHLPFVPRALPVLADVQPVWTEVDGRLRLDVEARIVNPATVVATVAGIRVKFLNGNGAWIGEVAVRVPQVDVPAAGDAAIAFQVERVPDGTASLEFAVVPAAAGPS